MLLLYFSPPNMHRVDCVHILEVNMKKTHRQINTVFKTPFSRPYWRAAAGEFSDFRMIVLAAMFIALTAVVGSLYIPVTTALRIKFSFLITSTAAMIYGPAVGIAAGMAGDIVGYLLASGGGAYFPGYTISAALASLVFALFLYRTRITPLRIFASRAVVNIFINALLGSLWSVIIHNKGFSLLFLQSIIKNLLLLPLEATALTLLISAMLPFLRKEKLVPPDSKMKLTATFVVLSIIFSLLCLVGLLICINYLPFFVKK